MKKITFVLFLICSISFGQDKVVSKLGDFSKLKIFSGLKIEIKKSNVSKIEISGKKADQVSVKNSNGTLKISSKILDGFNYEDLKVVLFYNNAIDIIDVNEGATIFSNNTIKQQHIELKTQEGARINLDINVKYLTVKTVSGGVVNVSGTAQNQTIDATAGGFYRGFDLKSVQANVYSSSGSVADVFVTEMLDAKVNFGGSIFYKGNPEELKTKKVIGGVIENRN